MTERRVHLESRLQAIGRSEDVVALGTAKEQETWRMIERMEPQLAPLQSDAESEEIIQHNLARIAKGRTAIIIAHRLSAVRQCHRIVTVEAGEVTETGTHAELLRAGGRYAQLHTKQMGGNI